MADDLDSLRRNAIDPVGVEDRTRWIVQTAVIINGQHIETRLLTAQDDRAFVIDGFAEAKEVANRLTAATQPTDEALVRFVYYAVPAGVLFETESEGVLRRRQHRRRRSTQSPKRLEDF